LPNLTLLNKAQFLTPHTLLTAQTETISYDFTQVTDLNLIELAQTIPELAQPSPHSKAFDSFLTTEEREHLW